MSAAGHSRRPSLGGQTFYAADAEQPYRARDLPALRQRNRGANAGVRAGTESDRNTLDVFALQLAIPECAFDQAECPGGSTAGFCGTAESSAFR